MKKKNENEPKSSVSDSCTYLESTFQKEIECIFEKT